MKEDKLGLGIKDSYISRLSSWYGVDKTNKVINRFDKLYNSKHEDFTTGSIQQYVNVSRAKRDTLNRYVKLYYPLTRN